MRRPLILPGHGQRLHMHRLPGIRPLRHQDSLLRIDTSLQTPALNHIHQLRRHGGLGRGERSRHGVERDAAEGDEILDKTLGADGVMEVGDVALQVEVEADVGGVGVEDGEAGAVLGGGEEGDGAADVRLEFEEVAERGAVEDGGLQLVAVHARQGAEAAVHGHVVAGQDLVVSVAQQPRVDAQEAVRGLFVVPACELRQPHGGGQAGLVALRVVVALRQVADLQHVGLDRHPVALLDGDVDDFEAHGCDVRGRGAVVAHPAVGFRGGAEVPDLVVM